MPVIPVVSVRANHPDGAPLYDGASVTLECEPLSGNLPVEITWVSPSGMRSKGSTLTIFISPESIGAYVCIGINSFGMHSSTFLVARAGNEFNY